MKKALVYDFETCFEEVTQDFYLEVINKDNDVIKIPSSMLVAWMKDDFYYIDDYNGEQNMKFNEVQEYNIKFYKKVSENARNKFEKIRYMN